MVRQAKPQYTTDARQKKIQGDVLSKIVVGIDGRVTHARVDKSLDGGFGLDYTALQAAKLWRLTLRYGDVALLPEYQPCQGNEAGDHRAAQPHELVVQAGQAQFNRHESLFDDQETLVDLIEASVNAVESAIKPGLEAPDSIANVIDSHHLLRRPTFQDSNPKFNVFHRASSPYRRRPHPCKGETTRSVVLSERVMAPSGTAGVVPTVWSQRARGEFCETCSVCGTAVWRSWKNCDPAAVSIAPDSSHC